MINMSAQKPNVSRFPFIFFNLSGFRTLLVTTLFSGDYLSKTSTMALEMYLSWVM